MKNKKTYKTFYPYFPPSDIKGIIKETNIKITT